MKTFIAYNTAHGMTSDLTELSPDELTSARAVVSASFKAMMCADLSTMPHSSRRPMLKMLADMASEIDRIDSEIQRRAN